MAVNSTAIPPPFRLHETNKWDGDIGNWSTFRIAIGTPPQNFRVLISTRGAGPWVPLPEACQGKNYSDCPTLRGVEPFNGKNSEGFQDEASGTWKNIVMYDLALEQNLGYGGSGMYGTDTVQLGYDQDPTALVMVKTLVSGFRSDWYYVGLLGLSTTETAVGAGNLPMKSFITNLKDTGKIPSSSYGYTAGAYYRDKKVPGSLVLGGYDQSRFEPADPTFDFGPDPDRPLQVGVQSIIMNASLTHESDVNLGESGHWSYIDSTVPELWLPENVCDQFQAAFGLSYDEPSKTYWTNESMHTTLLEMNPTLKFQFGNSISPSPFNTTEIVLPYAAFDVWQRDPKDGTLLPFFPLRRSSNDSQNTIGRIILQEAYLMVDNERKNFSLSPANFSNPMPSPDIRTIFSPGTVFPSREDGLSSGAKAGISIAALAAGLLLLLAVLLCWYKPRRTKKMRQREASVASAAPPYFEKQDHNQQLPQYTPSDNKPYDPWVEMPADQNQQRPELEGTQSMSYELAAIQAPAPVHEMEADVTGEGNATSESSTGGESSTSGERNTGGERKTDRERNTGGEEGCEWE